MTPILSLRDVHTHFGGLPAVNGVTLDAEPGRVLALIGPNGAGKSTLLRTISGLHRPSRGRIVLGETDITALPPHAIRQRGVAMVLQTPRPLWSMTARDNVALGAMFGTPGGRRGRRESRAAADASLDLVGLGGRAAAHVEALTLHEQRILDLARALAGRPRVLLLDEVMAGLTPGELEATMAVIRRVCDAQAVAVVWVEHVMGAVRALADAVAVLSAGRLLTTGSPHDVLQHPAVLEAYLGRAAVPGG